MRLAPQTLVVDARHRLEVSLELVVLEDAPATAAAPATGADGGVAVAAGPDAAAEDTVARDAAPKAAAEPDADFGEGSSSEDSSSPAVPMAAKKSAAAKAPTEPPFLPGATPPRDAPKAPRVAKSEPSSSSSEEKKKKRKDKKKAKAKKEKGGKKRKHKRSHGRQALHVLRLFFFST